MNVHERSGRKVSPSDFARLLRKGKYGERIPILISFHRFAFFREKTCNHRDYNYTRIATDVAACPGRWKERDALSRVRNTNAIKETNGERRAALLFRRGRTAGVSHWRQSALIVIVSSLFFFFLPLLCLYYYLVTQYSEELNQFEMIGVDKTGFRFPNNVNDDK